MFRTLIALAPLSMLIACEPIDPMPPRTDHPVEIQDGTWLIELSGAELTGRCGDLRPRDIEGAMMTAFIATPNATDVVIDMDDFVLGGARDGHSLRASGFMPMGGVSTPDEPGPFDEDDRPDDDRPTSADGDDVPPPCDAAPGGPDEDRGCEEAGERGVSIALRGEIDQPTLIFGDMTLDFQMPDMACTVDVAFTAELAGDCWDEGHGEGEVVVVESETEGRGSSSSERGPRDCGDDAVPVAQPGGSAVGIFVR